MGGNITNIILFSVQKHNEKPIIYCCVPQLCRNMMAMEKDMATPAAISFGAHEWIKCWPNCCQLDFSPIFRQNFFFSGSLAKAGTTMLQWEVQQELASVRLQSGRTPKKIKKNELGIELHCTHSTFDNFCCFLISLFCFHHVCGFAMIIRQWSVILVASFQSVAARRQAIKRHRPFDQQKQKAVI